MKILITGATGYVGSALVDDLRDKHEVVATARSIHRITQKGIKKAELDISNAEQVAEVIESEQPDLVIHAAALPKRSGADENVFIDTNVAGAKNVASAVAACANTKLVMISSGCAFKQQPYKLIETGSAREMGTIFSKSKNLAEDAVVGKFSGRGSRLAIIYPPVVLHPSQIQGIIPYALEDACKTGVLANKLPDGHLNFITHTELALVIDAIASDDRDNDVQRYMLTGHRLATQDFFFRLQTILQESFNISCDITEELDPAIETMCAMDEQALKALAPDFEWNNLDEMIEGILAENLRNRDDIKKPSGATIPNPDNILRS